MSAHSKLHLTDAQVARAAHELASQEQYNPAWLRPGVGATAGGDWQYKARAKMILEAALGSRAS